MIYTIILAAAMGQWSPNEKPSSPSSIVSLWGRTPDPTPNWWKKPVESAALAPPPPVNAEPKRAAEAVVSPAAAAPPPPPPPVVAQPRPQPQAVVAAQPTPQPVATYYPPTPSPQAPVFTIANPVYHQAQPYAPRVITNYQYVPTAPVQCINGNCYAR